MKSTTECPTNLVFKTKKDLKLTASTCLVDPAVCRQIKIYYTVESTLHTLTNVMCFDMHISQLDIVFPLKLKPLDPCIRRLVKFFQRNIYYTMHENQPCSWWTAAVAMLLAALRWSEPKGSN
jgi:hypothetical protein